MSALSVAKRFWCGVAGVAEPFPGAGALSVFVAPDSAICPKGWCGFVMLDGGALLTVPSAELAALVPDRGVAPTSLAEAEVLRETFGARESLGPAALAYLSEVDFRPVGGAEQAPENDEAVRTLIAVSDQDEVAESTVDDLHSPAFVVRDGDAVLAIAGYRRLPYGLAHLCVLTDRRVRNRGLARTVAAAAVAHALAAGLLPQWRARRAESRRVATALGFREYGLQLSVLPQRPAQP